MKPSEQFEIINRFRHTAPVDVEGLAKALGVSVQSAYLEPEISGMLERRKGGKFLITVNASHPETRRRFTIAHEFGALHLPPQPNWRRR